jgi:hypothetical protein
MEPLMSFKIPDAETGSPGFQNHNFRFTEHHKAIHIILEHFLT